MADVFVSYAREDAAKAKAVAREIEQAGFDVWIDQRIGSGSEYSREIERVLAEASAVVVVWSRNSIESAWVRDEAAEGRDSGRLVPVLIDDCRPPIGFRQFQATDLSHWSGRGKPKQLENVIAAIQAKAGTVQHPLQPAAARSRWFRRPLAWATVAIVTVAAGVAFMLVGHVDTQPTSAPSVALLPFASDSSDADARKLAAAAHDAVAHTLSQGAFAVRTIDSVPQGGRPAGDFLISGQLTGTADKLVATVRMEETSHHVVVFSHQFETGRDKTGDFAELIGAQVASQLSWTAPMIAMERRHPSDPAVISALLQGSAAGLDSIGTLHDYETARRLAGQAPNSPLAQNGFAFNTAFALYQIPRAERPQALAAARAADDRTVELAPEYGGAYIPWCLLHSEQRMVQCENRLRAGMRADSDAAFDDWFLSRLLNNVGRNGEAFQLASLSLAHDPYMPYKIGHMLRMLEVAGGSAEAAKLYKQARRWWPGEDLLYWNRLTGMLERGDFDAVDRLQGEASNEIGPQDRLPSLGPAVKRMSAAAVKAVCARLEPGPPCMLALAKVGDLDSAFRLADRVYPSRRGRAAADEERIWLDHPQAIPTGLLTGPAAAPLRLDPRFIALAARVGLLEYWRSGRLPDFCNPPQPEPLCTQLRPR